MSVQAQRNEFQEAVYRFYRQAAKLNLYVQFIKPPDMNRVSRELEYLSEQLALISCHIRQVNK